MGLAFCLLLAALSRVVRLAPCALPSCSPTGKIEWVKRLLCHCLPRTSSQSQYDSPVCDMGYAGLTRVLGVRWAGRRVVGRHEDNP